MILVHGFPESWASWRHQMAALAAAGWHVVAPDMRGYGRSEAPPDIDAYNIFELVGDLVGLVEALGAEATMNEVLQKDPRDVSEDLLLRLVEVLRQERAMMIQKGEGR